MRDSVYKSPAYQVISVPVEKIVPNLIAMEAIYNHIDVLNLGIVTNYGHGIAIFFDAVLK